MRKTPPGLFSEQGPIPRQAPRPEKEGGRLPAPLEGPWRLEFPFEPRYLESPSGLMHYVDEGSGPPAVFVHGNPTWSFMWRKALSALKGSYRAIAPDHIGMGLSERPRKGSFGYCLESWIEGFSYFMDHIGLGAEPVHLAAHDWGGPIALGWAAKNPRRVKSLALMNTGTRMPPGYELPFKLSLFKKSGPLGGFLIKNLGLFNRGVLSRGAFAPVGKDAREGFLAPYGESALREGVAAFVKDIPLKEGHGSKSRLSEVDKGLQALSEKPALLIWGLRDFVFTSRFLYDMKKRLPKARIVGLPRSGHLLLEDEPSKVIGALRGFWKKSGSREG